MLYVMCALKPEAQAFVDRYRLTKIMRDDYITIVVSGIGSKKMFDATKIIAKKMSSDDIIVNIGICAADKKYHIGQLLESSNIDLVCVDMPIDTQGSYEVVDMESSGFMEATKDLKNSFIFKVVSDHFEPNTVTKDKTKALIFNIIDEMQKKIEENI